MLFHRLVSLTETHPFVWGIAWFAVRRLPFLLPHDSSYLAIRHFEEGDNHFLLDVGANDGISAISFRSVDPRIRVLSLEPNAVHEVALTRLKQKDDMFDFKLVGAGDREASIKLYSPRYRGVRLHTFASTDPEQVRTAVAKSFGERIARAVDLEETVAPVVTVDGLKVEPAIIKVDVEGFELQVLIGSRETIAQNRPYLIVEACHSDLEPIHRFFDELSYTLMRYDPAADQFRPLTAGEQVDYASGARNVFAVPSEKLALLPIDPT